MVNEGAGHVECPLDGVKIGTIASVDPGRRQCKVGSLAGAARLSKDNAGVLR